MAAGDFPRARVSWPRTYRLVASHYPPIDLYDDIANPHDWDLIAAAVQRTNPRLLPAADLHRSDAFTAVIDDLAVARSEALVNMRKVFERRTMVRACLDLPSAIVCQQVSQSGDGAPQGLHAISREYPIGTPPRHLAQICRPQVVSSEDY